MSTRRTAARRRGKRPQKPDIDLAGWLVGQLLIRLPSWVFGQVGHLWAELEGHQRRELQGLGLVALASVVLVSVLAAGTPLHPAVWWAVGAGWPLLAGGLAVGGALLIHPPKRPVQRLQVVAIAVLAWTLLAVLSLASSRAGGALGQPGPLLARAIGDGWTALVLAAVAALAVVLAARLRMADAVTHAARAAGRARAPEKARPGRGPGRAAVRRPAAGGGDQVVEDRTAAPDPEPTARSSEDLVDDDDTDEGAAEVLEVRPATSRAVGDWTLPRLDLLAAPVARSRRAEAETQRQVSRIEAKLALQNIEAHVVGVDDGPSVTRYVLETGERVLVKQITARDRDLALALAASSIRIEAPIPGRSAIGIEVPKKERRLVVLRELIEAETLPTDALLVALGADVAGVPRLVDLRKAPHLLIGGATDQGKSVLMHALLASLLLGHSPATLRVLMIDPKRVELAAYEDLPHLACPVIQEMDQAAAALGWAVAEMERRYKTLAAAGARNIGSYNEKRAARGEASMSFVVVVVDELADLMMVSRQQAQAEKRAGCEVEDSIVRLGQLARAVGIHLVLATQRPSVDVVTGLIKANVPSRIAVTTATQVDSRTILDAAGAEKLTGRGDMLYSAVGGDPVRLQGPLVTETEVDAIVDHWRRQGRPDYLGGLCTPEPDAAAAARAARAGDES